jgi:lysozyme family protein
MSAAAAPATDDDDGVQGLDFPPFPPAAGGLLSVPPQGKLVAPKAPPFADVKDEYASLWASMTVRPAKQAELDKIVGYINAHRPRYETVAAQTRVPWGVIAAIHSLEASLSFRRHLYNGDPLSARTVHVPKGMPEDGAPPFTWEQSAVGALEYDGLTRNTDWSVAMTAYVFEHFNGFGYRWVEPPIPSPYLWCGSNHYTSGKFTEDHRYDPSATSDQVGTMVILKALNYAPS